MKQFIFLLLVIIWGCNSQQRLAGTYLSSGSDATSSEQLTLEANGEFKITSRSDVAGYFYAHGTWRRSRDTVYFEEVPIKTEPEPLEGYYSYAPDSDSVMIEAYWKIDSTGLYFAQLYLNDSPMPMDSIRIGVFVAKADSIRSIRLHIYGFEEEFEPPLGKANRFRFYYDSKSNQSVLVCRIRKVKGRKLIPLEPEFSIYRK